MINKSTKDKETQCGENICVRLVDQPSWLQSYSWEEIKTAQRDDKELSILFNWIENKIEPGNNVFAMSKAAKFYWINKELFILDEHKVLWKTVGDAKILVLSKSMRVEVMNLCHYIPTSGHQGVTRTFGRIREKFYWYSMSTDIQNYVASCADCNSNTKPTKHARCSMTKFHAGEPMERVHLDFLGPLPTTPRGNSFILMMVDQFTKWVECIPLPSHTTEVTARAAINEFFTRFGYPLQIFTDQGTKFSSKLFKDICEVLKISKTRTTPFRASANGQVERFNRTLMDAVRCFVSKTPGDWDESIPQIASALRSCGNRSTGFTPNMLMLGREIAQPLDLVYPLTLARHSDKDLDQYLAELIRNICIVASKLRIPVQHLLKSTVQNSRQLY